MFRYYDSHSCQNTNSRQGRFFHPCCFSWIKRDLSIRFLSFSPLAQRYSEFIRREHLQCNAKNRLLSSKKKKHTQSCGQISQFCTTGANIKSQQMVKRCFIYKINKSNKSGISRMFKEDFHDKSEASNVRRKIIIWYYEGIPNKPI